MAGSAKSSICVRGHIFASAEDKIILVIYDARKEWPRLFISDHMSVSDEEDSNSDSEE
jgi:hypothetical protein